MGNFLDYYDGKELQAKIDTIINRKSFPPRHPPLPSPFSIYNSTEQGLNFTNKRWRNSPPLKKEKAKKDVLGEGLPIYDGIDLPVSLIRRNNQGII